ncbi:MAG: arginine-tRNA-protein transferase [Verrucomicrobiota bacterium JB023]|nr:arginine-tRNA-protein transferase [Verrucomicrobiota bacterium JB023]
MSSPDPYQSQWPLINEAGFAERLPGHRMDQLWSEGWRHFGPRFFRYSLMWHEQDWKRVFVLRMKVQEWKPSKSQRRTLRRNEDVDVSLAPVNPGEEERALFERHKVRFKENVPSRLEEFLGDDPRQMPCECLQVSVRKEGRLIAASFLDIGDHACSSIYGIFEPEERNRRLGIFTIIKELEEAQRRGLTYYYAGYATHEPSPYDYKKELKPLQSWSWSGDWQEFDSQSG